MPTTTQNITWIELQANGWNRDGERGILPIYNEAQNILCMVENEQFIMVEDSTGDLPLLTTVAGTYLYTFPTTIWRVSDIVMATPIENEYDVYYLTNYGFEENLLYPLEYKYFGGRKYMRFKQVRTRDKRGSNAAQVRFTVDPGDTTELFRYIGYEIPTQITSEAIESVIDEQYHLSHLLPATLKLIEAFQNGNYVEAREYVAKVIRPDLWKELNKGAQGLSGHTTRREA